jgi:hypothetical protein
MPITKPLQISELKIFNDTEMHNASIEWQAVYVSANIYLNDNDLCKMDLIRSIVYWKKSKNTTIGFLKSLIVDPRGLDWINALEEDVQSKGKKIISQAEYDAVNYMQTSSNAILKDILRHAELKYRNTVSDGISCMSSVSALKSAIDSTQTVKINAAVSVTPAILGFTPDLPSICKEMMRGLDQGFIETTIFYLGNIIGEKLLEKLNTFIPYVGTVLNGVSTIKTGIQCAQRGFEGYKTRERSRSVRPGTPQAAVEALRTILIRDVVELGIQTAESAAEFSCGVASLATGTDAGKAAVSVLVAIESIMRLIYNVITEFMEINKANELIQSGKIEMSILSTCPLLGAQIIAVAPHSVLINYAYSIVDEVPNFGIVAEQNKMKILCEDISELKVSAIEVLKRSRFIVSYGEEKGFEFSFRGIKKTAKETICEQLSFIGIKDENGFNVKTNRLPTENLYKKVAKEHKQEQALLRQEDALRTANIFLKQADRQTLRQENELRQEDALRTANIFLKQADRQTLRQENELRQEDALTTANIFLKKADDEKSIIDLINETEALIERQEMRERIKNRGIEANRKQQRLIIATSVDEALREYDRETNTGFSSYFTIQSSESMNAKTYLQRISSNLNDKKDTERLVNAILWLLNKGGKQPNDLSNRLKIGSRFYIKLSDSYTKWCVFLPDQGILS